jgi:hypothetical protein
MRPESFHDGLRKVQRPSAACCLELREADAFTATNELASNVDQGHGPGKLHVGPAESQHLPPAEAERQGDHIGRLKSLSFHGTEELPSLLRSQCATFSTRNAGTIGDGGDIAASQALLLGTSQSPAEYGTSEALSFSSKALRLKRGQHPADVRRRANFHSPPPAVGGTPRTRRV